VSLRKSARELCGAARSVYTQFSERYPESGSLELKTCSFADSTVLYHSLAAPVDAKPPILRSVAPVFGAISQLMLSGMAGKVYMRGAIEIGMGCELPEGDPFGHVMVSCHRIEAELASTLRVVVGPTLLAMIEQGKVLSEGVPNYLVERRLAERAASYIAKDVSDRRDVLDYLRVAKSMFGSQPGLDALATRALGCLHEEEDYWTQLHRPDWAAKYGAAIKYFASHGYGEKRQKVISDRELG
jgi:hypothetical protein